MPRTSKFLLMLLIEWKSSKIAFFKPPISTDGDVFEFFTWSYFPCLKAKIKSEGLMMLKNYTSLLSH
jgi:hypothetical protein